MKTKPIKPRRMWAIRSDFTSDRTFACSNPQFVTPHTEPLYSATFLPVLVLPMDKPYVKKLVTRVARAIAKANGPSPDTWNEARATVRAIGVPKRLIPR